MDYPLVYILGVLTWAVLQGVLRAKVQIRRPTGEREAIVTVRVGPTSSDRIPTHPELPAVTGDKPDKGE